MFRFFKKKKEPSVLEELAKLGKVGPIEVTFYEDAPMGPDEPLASGTAPYRPQVLVRRLSQYIDFGDIK